MAELLFSDVSDPTDFELSELQAVDGAFRCPMCKEVFVGPVFLPQCGHVYCSLVSVSPLPR